MNRLIAHVLQKTGYLAVFIGLAYVLACKIDTGGDKRPPNGIQYLLTPVLIYFLVLGYGALLRGEVPRERRPWIWLAGAVVFCGAPRMLWFYTSSWERMRNTFVPSLRMGDLLETIGHLDRHVVDIWMPIAAILSMIAAIISICDVLFGNQMDEK